MPLQLHLSVRTHLVGDQVAQLVRRLLAGLQTLLVHPVAQLVHQMDGDFAAHIRKDQLLFQTVVEIIVDLAAGEGVQDIAPEARAGLFQTILHLVFFFFAESKESHCGLPYCMFFSSVMPSPSLLRNATVHPLSRTRHLPPAGGSLSQRGRQVLALPLGELAEQRDA